MRDVVVAPATMDVGFRTNHHLMMAGFLGVAVTEAMVAAVNSLVKKIPYAPSCESYSIVIVVV